ncbi:RidA family protein [Thalassospira lucentensis]|uniref:RidA family protein n=1 Tax=Thalassospira lucentensis TaxID=168935 RepID=UPI003AA7DE75
MIDRIHTNQRMSKIVKYNGTLYLCGQVGKEGDSVTEQTLECLCRIDALLKEAETSKENLLTATIWLSDISDKPEMDKVWDAWIPESHAPARACGEARLGHPDLKVEIIVTAACTP